MQVGIGGQCRHSIFLLDKAVLSPPFTPPRNAGREYDFTARLTAPGHLFNASSCHHFLRRVIKSAISRTKNCGNCRSIQVSKVLSSPLLTDILEVP